MNPAIMVRMWWFGPAGEADQAVVGIGQWECSLAGEYISEIGSTGSWSFSRAGGDRTEGER